MDQRHKVMVVDVLILKGVSTVSYAGEGCHAKPPHPFATDAEFHQKPIWMKTTGGMKQDKTKKFTPNHEAHPGQTELHRGWAGHGR